MAALSCRLKSESVIAVFPAAKSKSAEFHELQSSKFSSLELNVRKRGEFLVSLLDGLETLEILRYSSLFLFDFQNTKSVANPTIPLTTSKGKNRPHASCNYLVRCTLDQYFDYGPPFTRR